jgi:hypothetical protein
MQMLSFKNLSLQLIGRKSLTHTAHDSGLSTEYTHTAHEPQPFFHEIAWSSTSELGYGGYPIKHFLHLA